MNRIAVIEHFTSGKVSDVLNEDALVVTPDIVAVVDGVTAKNTFLLGGRTVGKLAAEFVAGALRDVEPTAGIRQIVDSVNARFAAFYASVNFPLDPRQHGPQAMAVIYSRVARTIWMIGDCQVAVDGQTRENPKRSDEILSQFRSLMLAILSRERGDDDFLREHDDARAAILPWVLKSTIFANDASSPFGYSVFNGEDIPDTLIPTISLDTASHEIVLTSDGYLTPAPTLQQAEASVARLLSDDPYRYRQSPSTKGIRAGQRSFDDRTYIRFTV